MNRRTVLSAALSTGIWLAGAVGPARAQIIPVREGPPTYPEYRPLRADDDFSYLQTDSLRTARPDWFNPLKYTRLGARPGWYLSVGGEVRLQYERFHNERWGDVPPGARDENGHLLQRYMLHADLHLGPHLRVFVQPHRTAIAGRRGGPRPSIDEDRLDVYQAFVDVAGRGAGPDQGTTLRLGRQEMSYGVGRLLSTREGPNTRQSFDAARLLLRRPGWQLDVFVARPVLTNLGVFDDRRDPEELLWAAYAVRSRPARQRGVDVYYIGQERRQPRYFQGSAREVRHTLGTRVWSTRAPFAYDVEVVGQAGRFGGARILAYYVSAVGFYHLKQLPLNPRLLLATNLISGDRDPANPRLQTFNPLYPRNYLGQATPIGSLNSVDLHPALQLFPTPRLMVMVEADWLWRLSARDAVYSPAVVPVVPLPPPPGEVPPPLSGRRFIGTQYGLATTYQVTPHLLLGATYVHFPAGPFLRATTPGRTLTYFSPVVTYRF